MWHLRGSYFSDKRHKCHEHFAAKKSEQNKSGNASKMPRKTKGNIPRTHLRHAATKQKRQCSERIRGNIAKIDMRKCRAAMPHSSVTLRYYRANTCFCLLFSHPLRMLYTSPKPHFVDAKAPSSPSTCTSSFPRAASPRHPGCRVLSVKNADTLPSEFST